MHPGLIKMHVTQYGFSLSLIHLAQTEIASEALFSPLTIVCCEPGKVEALCQLHSTTADALLSTPNKDPLCWLNGNSAESLRAENQRWNKKVRTVNIWQEQREICEDVSLTRDCTEKLNQPLDVWARVSTHTLRVTPVCLPYWVQHHFHKLASLSNNTEQKSYYQFKVQNRTSLHQLKA